MTQELKPITRGAQELRKLLEEHGRLAQQDARDWLAEQDPELTPSTINFVFGHGKAPNRHWWHEDAEGFLVNGPKPVQVPEGSPNEVPVPLSDEVKKPRIVDPSTMSEPRDQFYTIALNLGILEKAARTTAFNCWNIAEMNDPTEAWQAIVQSSDLRPSQKKGLWRNWCSWAGIKIPEGLVAQVEKQYTVLGATDKSKDLVVAPAARRRFIAVKGEVMMVEPDDAGGMSFSEAVMMADRQQDPEKRSASAQSENGVVVALITQSGENQRAAQQESGQNLRAILELSKKDDSGGLGPLLIANLENQRRETELRFQNMEERRRQDEELAREKEDNRRREAQDREDRRMEKMDQMLQQVISQGNERKGPFDAIEQLAPGFTARLMDNFLNPPRQENAFKIKIGDEEGTMSLDDYERYSAIQSKREVIQMVRQRLPEFVEMGKDFAIAAQRASQGGREAMPDPRQTVRQTNPGFTGYCVECIRMVVLPENIDQFICPYCGAHQSLAGEVLAAGKPEHRVAPILDTLLEPEDEQPVSEEVDLEASSPVSVEEPVLAGGAASD